MKNKTILITGGASGIGLAIVEKFAAEGSQVFFIDFNESEGKAVEKVLEKKGEMSPFCMPTSKTKIK